MKQDGQKFAHDVVYSGSEAQLIQFAEALIAAGYTDPNPDSPLSERAKGNRSISTFGSGEFGFFLSPVIFSDDIAFPSNQLSQAIETATKLAE